MGVYIKDMEVPKTCEDCNLESFCDRWVEARKMCGELAVRTKATIRHPDCPLIPVQEHGDLIDRDALEDELDNFCQDSWVYNTLYHAPTVIPASEEVYRKYTDTAGNLHWTGTKSGEHIIRADFAKGTNVPIKEGGE